MSEIVRQETAFRFEIEDAVRRYADMVYRLAVLNTSNEFEGKMHFRKFF